VDDIHVELVSPREPLGWALGVAEPAEGPFVASWHAERRLGATTAAAQREAALRRPGSGAIDVRVYGDDGSVAALRRRFPE
jgi:hypothetical protein